VERYEYNCEYNALTRGNVNKHKLIDRADAVCGGVSVFVVENVVLVDMLWLEVGVASVVGAT
jgi:hypothetical protein